jgi:hypothetical protein
MSNTQVDDWTLVREKFEALVRERSDNIDDLLDAQFCNRFSQLITHATDRARLRAHSGNGRAQAGTRAKIENGRAPAGTRAKIVDEPLDDSDPTFRGTVYALVVITGFCSAALGVGAVFGNN